MVPDLGLLQPYWLLLLPLPWVWLRWRRRRPQPWPSLMPPLAIRYPLLSCHSATPVEPDRQRHSPRADRMLAVSMVLLLAALAQPVRYTEEVALSQASEPVDLILVVGTAISMTLRDYEIDGQRLDRMAMTRHLLDGFVADYSGSRAGLVILGNPPALWLPLTTDKAVVRDAISRIRTVLGGRLTDMGATLELVRASFTEPRDTVVVLITDGGLQLGAVSPQEAARELAAAGFTLYVLAVGSGDPGAPVSDSEGALIYQPAALGSLRELAQIGGGQLFHAVDTQAFRDALVTIETKHRKPAPASRHERPREPWYPLPLGFAMFLLLYTGLARQPAGKRHIPGSGA